MAPGASLPRWVSGLARIGAVPDDSSEQALRRETLVLWSSLIATLAVAWVVTYAVLGLYASALIPFTYQVVSVANLVVFAKTKRYRIFRLCELGLTLVLPFVLQLSLGGFVASSGVVLWSFTAPLGALLFAGRREAVVWFVAYAVLVGVAGIVDPHLVSRAGDIPHVIQVLFFVLNIVGVTGTGHFLLEYFVRERDRAAALVAHERERSERLLLNVLPRPIADRLKSGESLIADRREDVGVLFADLVDFTPVSAQMTAADTVEMLNGLFSAFDELAVARGLEKIKTIGDAYMVASGLLDDRDGHSADLAAFALDVQDLVQRASLRLRIGMDVGPVVAGVIGRQKFIYDLWGDTVNTASRMESHGVPGSIQVTERTYRHLCERFELEERGLIEVKGKGQMRTYFLRSRRDA